MTNEITVSKDNRPIVKHKALGTGEVKGIDGGILVVVFDGVDKKFQFSGALEQCFLKLDE